MKKIIIVDDDEAILDSISMVLKRVGHELTLLTNGNSLMNGEIIVPDLFLIDKQLPGVDGLEICKHLKSQELTKGVPVVIISASPNIHTLAKEAGADDVIEKPYNKKTLMEIVEKYIS